MTTCKIVSNKPKFPCFRWRCSEDIEEIFNLPTSTAVALRTSSTSSTTTSSTPFASRAASVPVEASVPIQLPISETFSFEDNQDAIITLIVIVLSIVVLVSVYVSFVLYVHLSINYIWLNDHFYVLFSYQLRSLFSLCSFVLRLPAVFV